MRALISFKLEKLAQKHAENAPSVLFATASLFRLSGWFHIDLFVFYLSKVLEMGTMHAVLDNQP